MTYMAITAVGCTPDDWSEIIAAAVSSAKKGDAQARQFLARYLLGNATTPAPDLVSMAADEIAGVDRVTQRALTARMGKTLFP
jgi:hypothetical protein